jgi:hypothetical protein
MPFWPAQGGALAAAALAAVWALNVPFLIFLGRARGLKFFIQSLLFLPVNLWVSGLGAAKGVLDFARGRRY